MSSSSIQPFDSAPVPVGERAVIGLLVDDLVEWIDRGLQPTGIQRVVSELVVTAAVRSDVAVVPVVTTATRGHVGLQQIDRNRVRWGAVGARPEPQGTRHFELRNVAKRVLPFRIRHLLRLSQRRGALIWQSIRPVVADDPVDLLVVAGSYWTGETPARISRVRRRGVPIRVLIYDLIPIDHPEWFGQAYSDEFRTGLETVLPLAERVVTLGADTARQLAERYPWAAAKTRVAVPDLVAHAPRSSVRAKDGPPFLLAPGTVEPRKNHRVILDAWALARRDQRLKDSRLVICGRRGWQTEDIEAEIDRTGPGLQIDRVDDASDAELDALYAGCRGTVHASVTEGLGLPPRESIVRGLPTLMSRAIPRDGLPEGSYKLFDPTDTRELARLIVEVMTVPATRCPIDLSGGTGWEPVLAALID